MERYIIVTTFCKDKQTAEAICDTLLNKNLVAGCQVSKADSKYWYNGSLQMAHEYRLEFRSVASFYDLIRDEIAEIHNYEIPEISCVEIKDANDEFIEWINQYTVESYEPEDEEDEEYEEDEDDKDFGLL